MDRICMKPAWCASMNLDMIDALSSGSIGMAGLPAKKKKKKKKNSGRQNIVIHSITREERVN